MPREDIAPIAEAKQTEESPRAPLRLMTQFLRAVSEGRMEDALALSETILTFEPYNAIILDYQATLAQYINNERELDAQEGDVADDASGDDDDNAAADDDDGSSAEEESPSSSTGTHASTEEASDDDKPEGEQGAVVAGPSNSNARVRFEMISRQGSEGDDQELQRLGGLLRELREKRAAESMKTASRWDEEKFAASRREVEDILWKFLPEEAKQAAQKRGQDAAPDEHSRAHHK
ncbi:unnamed protein product [Pylaiella littoralis]